MLLLLPQATVCIVCTPFVDLSKLDCLGRLGWSFYAFV